MTALNPFYLESAAEIYEAEVDITARDRQRVINWLESLFHKHRYSGGAFQQEAKQRAQDIISTHLIWDTEEGLAEFGELVFEDWTEAMGCSHQFTNLQLDNVDWFDIGGYLARRLDLVNGFYEWEEDEEEL
jgi:hypothetical protein